jgi:hypothetical protein
VAAIAERARKLTTFLLAAFLWAHALFFLNVHSALLSKCIYLLRLTSSEALVFGLLVIFSLLAGSGFWRMVRSLLYIYFFPFALLGYGIYRCFRILRAVNRWFLAQAPQQPSQSIVIEQKPAATVTAIAASASEPAPDESELWKLLHYLSRPFRKFTLLWCILLLATTHITIVWLCLVVILAQLGRKILLILRVLFFSDPWLRKIGPALFSSIQQALDTLAGVTRDAAPTNELRNLWNQLKGWRKILDFLKNSYLLSRWAWVLATVFFGSLYAYIAILFSFAYYGIARVSGANLAWPDALVASLFIPFFISDLPRVLALRFLSGIHCTLVVVVGVGTIVNFLRRRLDAVWRAATDLSERLADQSVHEKYIILEQKFSTSAASNTPEKGSEK